MTKPLYKRDWFQVFFTGVVLTTVGFILIADLILSSTDTYMGIWYGIFFGMGQTDMVSGVIIRQYEKKLDAKNVEQKASQ
jgi:hypothetical protein